MDFVQIKYFLEVAKNEHITKSAEALHISQPSLTQSIHNLENSLGVPLFRQKGRNIVLTEYGKYFEKRVTPIMAELEKIPYELKSMAKTHNETIRINVLAGTTLLANAIIEYKRTNQDVHFQLLQNDDGENADIEISTKLTMANSFDNSQSEYVYKRTEEVFLAVPNVSEYEGLNSIRLSEVKDEGFICIYGSRLFRVVCDKLCKHANFTPNIVFESDNPSAVINMIASNIGVGFFPEFSWGKVDNKNIKLLEIEDCSFKRDIIITLKQKSEKHIADFYRFLIDYINKITK